MHPIRSLTVLAALVAVPALAPATVVAQGAPHPVLVGVPAAAPADVASIDAIIAALYDVISGPVGERRDWARMRSLFIPGGRLIPTQPRPDGSTVMRLMEVNDYIATSGPYLEQVGFTEHEIARRTERWGQIAHVFSTYEGRMQSDGSTIRGINSIQLVNDGTRWWVVSVFWEAERPENPLPAEYLVGS